MRSRPPELRAKRWLIAPPIADHIHKRLNHIHPILLQVLANRELVDEAHIQGFLAGQYLENDDPFLLADMDKAVERIRYAIENQERVVVYGDFDADGVTSTVLLTEALRGLSLERKKAVPYIPDRVDEGYGLNKDALTELKEAGTDLVITVDCGIRSVAEVEHANALGLDMIVTDHHSIGTRLPPAVAVINPKRRDSKYPERMLAGVGIAYKLAQALYQALPEFAAFDLDRVLDLVAIGTVADLAPLQGENRRLVMQGLRVLNTAGRPGVAALNYVARLTAGQLSAESIAFAIGPRINAAGRLAHAYDAARLLAAPDPNSAEKFAKKLERLNRERQQLTSDLSERAEMMISADAPLLVVSDTDFAPGIVGLVASRLAEKYYRPSIVIEKGEHESRGSCRSIPEFHITRALDKVAHLLVRHGGHAQAAGFTIANENLDAFEEAMLAHAQEALAGKDLRPSLTIDAAIDLSSIDWALHESLAQLEPTGQANRQPIFMSKNVQVLNHRVVGKDGSHLQLEVSNGLAGFKCIAFRQGPWANCMPRKVDIAYSLGVNEWRGRRSLQLIVKDIRHPAV